MITYRQPVAASIRGDTWPVKAPSPSQNRSGRPDRPCSLQRGGGCRQRRERRGDHDVPVGDFGNLRRSFLTKSTASSAVLYIFQLPAISGLRKVNVSSSY